MKNLVKGLLAIGAVAAVGYAIAKRNDEQKDESQEVDLKKEEVVKKAIMIAGGVSIVYMMINNKRNSDEITRLWDMTEVNKILWADRLYKDGVIDEVTRNNDVVECMNHINNIDLRNSIYEVLEVK